MSRRRYCSIQLRRLAVTANEDARWHLLVPYLSTTSAFTGWHTKADPEATPEPRESCESFRVDPDLEPSCHLPATSRCDTVVQTSMNMKFYSSLVLRPWTLNSHASYLLALLAMPPDARKGTAKEFFGAEFRLGPPSFAPTLPSAVDVRGESSLQRALLPARLYQGKPTFEVRCRRVQLSRDCPGRRADRGFSRALQHMAETFTMQDVQARTRG